MTADYERDGFDAPIRTLPEAEAEDLCRYFQDFDRRAARQVKNRYRLKVHLLSPRLCALVKDPRLTAPVAAVLGPDLLAWSVDIFMKVPGQKTFVSWHQDALYWGLDPVEATVTAWLALTPSVPENGCVRMVRGSHRRGLLPHAETDAAGNMLSRGQAVEPDWPEEACTDICLRPGEMSLHHAFTVHSSNASSSDHPRIGFAVRYMTPDVRQTKGTDSALPVRGNPGEHFVLEPAPSCELDDDALAAHRAALAYPSGGGPDRRTLADGR